MTVIEKLKQLRTLMNERNMDVYMIPTSDFHETEYVGEHFKARSFMSGFTGSAGTLIVCRDCAAKKRCDRCSGGGHPLFWRRTAGGRRIGTGIFPCRQPCLAGGYNTHDAAVQDGKSAL